MKQLRIDPGKCTGCGLCVKECGFNRVITMKGGKAYYGNSENCMECLHCFKICPNSAIDFIGGDGIRAKVYDHDEVGKTVIARHSCRDYKPEPLDRELLTGLINASNTAPRFDISFDERKFILIDDSDKLSGVRTVVLNQIKKARNLFRIIVRNPFLTKSRKAGYYTIIELFTNIIEKNRTCDSLFHGASTLVIVAGQKKKNAAKDNSLYAMSQFLIAAEEEKIGTCINGFVSFFAKAVHKYLEISKDYSIHCAAVAGHPATNFNRQIVRGDSSISWNSFKGRAS